MTPSRLAPRYWRHDAYTLRSLARALASQLEHIAPAIQKPGSQVVDLGAGEAPYRGLFEGLGAQYKACDLGEDAPVRIVPGAEIPLPDHSADAVLSFQVLEHVWDLDWYLGQARRLLKPDGVLILSTHGTWPYHPHPTDFRRWTRDGLVAELEGRGFTVRSVRAVVGPLAWTTQFRALGYHAVLSRVPLLGSLLSAVVCSAMHLRMQVEDALTPGDWIDRNAAIYLVEAHSSASSSVTYVDPLPPAHP